MHVAVSGVLRATTEPNGVCDRYNFPRSLERVLSSKVVEKQLLQSDFLIGDFLTLADIVLVRWAAV